MPIGELDALAGEGQKFQARGINVLEHRHLSQGLNFGFKGHATSPAICSSGRGGSGASAARLALFSVVIVPSPKRIRISNSSAWRSLGSTMKREWPLPSSMRSLIIF